MARGTRTPTFGLTLGVLLCVSAVAYGSPAAPVALAGRSLERASLSNADQEALASLLAQLSEAAKHVKPNRSQAGVMLGAACRDAPAPRTRSRPSPRPDDHDVVAAEVPLDRLNLPPPTSR